METILTIIGMFLGVIFLIVLIKVLFKILPTLISRFLYIIFFYFPIKGVNILLIYNYKREKLKEKLKEKGEDGALIYLLKYFKIFQYIIGFSLIAIYGIITFYISKNYFDSYILITIGGVIFYTIIFFSGKHSYINDENEIVNEVIDENENIEEITIEGLGNLDFGDLISDIDFSIDIDIDIGL